MIAHDGLGGTCTQHGSHGIEHFENFRTTIDEIAQEDDLSLTLGEPVAAATVIAKFAQQGMQLVRVAVNIANEVVSRKLFQVHLPFKAIQLIRISHMHVSLAAANIPIELVDIRS